MNEAKKGFRAKKHRVASIEPSKPRNFVAKNAKMGGAGAHKDKKKAVKFGDTKHKKDYVEHLQAELEIEMLVERQINETGLDPLRRMKAIQYIANKTGWEINYLELASDEEIMDLYVKVKKGEIPKEEMKEDRDMCSVCGQTPCNCTHVTEGAKVDRQAAHITKSMMKKGKSREEAEAIAWAHIKHPKKKKKTAHEGWTHDTLAAELFEQELTYEDTLNNMLAKELKK